MADKYVNKTDLTYYHGRINVVFATKDALSTLQSQVDGIEGDIPTATSDLTNDSGFITSAVNNLANYYLTSQTYTKAEVDSLISGISGVSFEIVQTLQQTGDAGTIYLVPSSGSGTNIYDEYIYVNSNWEKIGSTDVDLSQYWAKADLVAMTTAEIDALFE